MYLFENIYNTPKRISCFPAKVDCHFGLAKHSGDSADLEILTFSAAKWN